MTRGEQNQWVFTTSCCCLTQKKTRPPWNETMKSIHLFSTFRAMRQGVRTQYVSQHQHCERSIRITEKHLLLIVFLGPHARILPDRSSQQVLIRIVLWKWDKHIDADDECVKYFDVSQRYRTKQAILQREIHHRNNFKVIHFFHILNHIQTWSAVVCHITHNIQMLKIRNM